MLAPKPSVSVQESDKEPGYKRYGWKIIWDEPVTKTCSWCGNEFSTRLDHQGLCKWECKRARDEHRATNPSKTAVEREARAERSAARKERQVSEAMAKSEYQSKVGWWLDNHTLPRLGARVYGMEIYQAWVDYCASKDWEPGTQNAFSRQLTRQKVERRHDVNGNYYRLVIK